MHLYPTQAHYYQMIRKKAIQDAYKLVEKFIEFGEDGSIEWKGRPASCLARLRVLSDRPVELLVVEMDPNL